tara:strand:+ start:220 stop:450 length:231 start_codon:yes stop_codon:yes gene_type:complete
MLKVMNQNQKKINYPVFSPTNIGAKQELIKANETNRRKKAKENRKKRPNWVGGKKNNKKVRKHSGIVQGVGDGWKL